MTASTPASRDEFPMNAFALLPPSVTNEQHGHLNPSVISIAPVEPIRVEECDAQIEVSADNPIGLLKLNLAHTELRGTIETLYHTIETLEQDLAMLTRENARLVDVSERAKVDAAKEIDKVREKLHARDHEAMQVQQRLREVDTQKERLQSELAEQQLKLEERDATINSLQTAVETLQNQQAYARDGSRYEAELRRLVEMWSSKERSVGENTDHVRNATTDVQRLAEQMQIQLKQVQSELLAIEKEYSTFRGFLDHHKCSQQVCGGVALSEENTSSHQELQDMRSRIMVIEQAKLELTTENQVLRTKCKEYAKSIRLLSSRIDQIQAKEMAAHSLILKYQESADDGTQAIAELQESLVKLCDQLAQERQQHIDRVSEQMRSALDSETCLRQEIEILVEKLKKSNQNLEAVKDTASAPAANSCTLRTGTQSASTPHRSPDRKSVDQVPAQSLQPPPPQASQQTRTPQSIRTPVKESGSSQRSIRSAFDDKPEVLNSAEQQTGAKRDREKRTSHDVTEQATVCRLCNEEPFGFMVRCQKCKDPFHAGCVKKTGTGAKKRLSHIFKCSNCAPHRPTKVPRCGGAEGTGKTTTLEDEETEPQRTATTSLHVIPLRNAAVVARPFPRQDN